MKVKGKYKQDPRCLTDREVALLQRWKENTVWRLSAGVGVGALLLQ